MRKADQELSKHTLLLYEGDYQKLQDHYPEVGASPIIRLIVHRYLEQIEANGGSIDAKVEIKI